MSAGARPPLPTRPRPAPARASTSRAQAVGLSAVWCALAAACGLAEGPARWAALAVAGLAGTALTAVWLAVLERRRWSEPVSRLARQADANARGSVGALTFDGPPWLSPLADALQALSDAANRRGAPPQGGFTPPGESGTFGASPLRSPGPAPALTRSGLYEFPSDVFETVGDSSIMGSATASAEFARSDMVNRLDPRSFRWLESSPAEQKFLGWSVEQLRAKSFLEIVHPDDAQRAREELSAALVKGEVHNLILRIRTAAGKPRAVEMNVGTRYAPDRTVSHLRCHVTDITSKLRADRELRQRTRELTALNEQLRAANGELEELKERYRDLYQNAPAMYFSLDERGNIADCNDTLLATLGYARAQLVNDPYEKLLPEAIRARSRARFAEFKRTGVIEVDSQWVKAGGEVIDVWISGSAVRSFDGRVLHSRSVAQDVTARHRLEAELKRQNDRLARANAELHRRNREMDEFTYVVSHDLQEPLRTLIAFSDFLLKDYGDRVGTEGKEYVLHLVDASRRMRSLIQDLLALARAGKVTSEFGEVNLGDVIALVRADLAELIRSRGAAFRAEGPWPAVWGDRARLGQLLANLVTNALKYNDKPEPTVEVRAEPGRGDDEGRVVLAVADNGIGIEKQFHAKIFQLFRRLHTREEYEGTGAGLAICDKIVQAHGGKLWVESEPGVGSTFYASLPARPPHDPQHPPRDA